MFLNQFFGRRGICVNVVTREQIDVSKLGNGVRLVSGNRFNFFGCGALCRQIAGVAAQAFDPAVRHCSMFRKFGQLLIGYQRHRLGIVMFREIANRAAPACPLLPPPVAFIEMS